MRCSEAGLRVVAWMDRHFPRWLLRWLIALGRWFAHRQKARRYVLLLEDLAPAQT